MIFFLTSTKRTGWVRANMSLIHWLVLFFMNWNAFPKPAIPWNGEGFNFEIIDMDGHRIDKILVTASKEIKDEIGE